MVAISEDLIMEVIESFDRNEKAFFAIQESISNSQPAIAAMLTDESMELLNDDEYELLWFVIIVVYQCITQQFGDVLPISTGSLERIEEDNWELLGENVNVPFRARLDTFYARTNQEDLLSFIEDSFESDDEMHIAPASREVLFITAKSCMDAFLDGVVA